MDWKSFLSQQEWEEGKVIHFPASSYRHRIVATCYKLGRQTAQFANGTFNYGAFVCLMRPDGSWISEGNNIVPVLPDGRIIMVVEQRPAQGAYIAPEVITREGQEPIDLAQFGPYSMLQFPGGAVDQNEEFKSGFLRELQEETGVEEQSAELFMRERWLYPGIADMALRMKTGVIKLSGVKFENFVHADGGLHVFAMTQDDIRQNIWAGNLASVQEVQLSWSFLQELNSFGQYRLEHMIKSGYISRKEVKIKKQ